MSKKKGPGRCTGHCCRSFSVRYNPEELQRLAAASKSRGIGRDLELEKLAAMVIYLGQFNTNPIQKLKNESWTHKALRIAQRAEMVPPGKDLDYDGANGPHWYACRHLQPNGDCGVYNDNTKRPALCDAYPNGEMCLFEECTMPIDTQVERLSSWGESDAIRYFEQHKLIMPKSLLKKKKERQKERHILARKLEDVGETSIELIEDKSLKMTPGE